LTLVKDKSAFLVKTSIPETKIIGLTRSTNLR